MNNKKAFWIFIATLIVVICLPFILSQPAIWFGFNADTAVIGDTIGGITAPVTGVVTVYFLYLAFSQQNSVISSQEEAIQAQLASNEAQRKAIEAQQEAIEEQRKLFQIERDYESVESALKNLRDSYNDVQIESYVEGKLLKEYKYIAILRLQTILYDQDYESINLIKLAEFQSLFTFFINDLRFALLRLKNSFITTKDKIAYSESLLAYVEVSKIIYHNIDLDDNIILFNPIYSADKTLRDQFRMVMDIADEYETLLKELDVI